MPLPALLIAAAPYIISAASSYLANKARGDQSDAEMAQQERQLRFSRLMSLSQNAGAAKTGLSGAQRLLSLRNTTSTY